MYQKIINKYLDRKYQKSIDAHLSHWKEQSKDLLGEEQQSLLFFQNELLKDWEEALHLSDVLRSISRQLGEDLNNRLSPQEEVLSLVLQVLFGLHARGVQVTTEALLLLRNGLAYGAYARWRTLHELTVTAIFISEHGEEVAERYLLHQHIMNYDHAITYRKYAEAVHLAPVEDGVFEELKKRRDELADRYDDNFRNKYWWAEEALRRTGHKGRVNMYEIEKSIGYDFFRPFVAAANIDVHAGPKGITPRSNFPPGINRIYDLCEPGQHVAWSMYVLTRTLLLSEPEPDLHNLAGVAALEKLATETFYAFVDAEERQLKAGSGSSI